MLFLFFHHWHWLISENSKLIEGKRIGIVTNQTALLSNGVHLVDTLYNDKRFKVTALFGPEHGIRGEAPAGVKVINNVDPKNRETITKNKLEASKKLNV